MSMNSDNNKVANLFDYLPEQLDEEVFTEILDHRHTRIERIVSRGHSSPQQGWYEQYENEWVLLLEGAAIIAFEDGTEVSLQRGDYLNLPAHRKHRVKWTDPDQVTIWLAIFYT